MNTKQEISCDILIVGAGPSGLFAGFQTGMLEMKTVIIDALPFPGGQCMALYPEKEIYDIGGIPSITGQDFTDQMIKQIEPFNHEMFFNEVMDDVSGEIGNFFISTTNYILNAKVVILATGKGLFSPNKPPLNNINDFEGKSVFYSITNKNSLAGKTIAIAGGGDSAIDWAIILAEIAEMVYIIHRRTEFRCAPHNKVKIDDLAELGKIKIKTPYQLHSIIGKNGVLEQIQIIKDNKDIEALTADILLPFFGLITKSEKLDNLNIQLSANGHIIVDKTSMMTSRNGIYSIGDGITYDGKLPLISLGFAEAVIATHNAFQTIFPHKQFRFVHSTTKGIPNAHNKP